MFCHFSCILRSVKFGSSVVRLDKRDKAYKAQAHCLTYALTGLREMFHLRR